MNNARFLIYGELPVDYSLLGQYPENIDSFKGDELLNYFVDCYKLTFTNTVFSYYGDMNEIKIQLEQSLIKEELEYDTRTNKEKWAILFLVVLDLFFVMHNTYLAQDTIADVVEMFDMLDDDERLNIIYDLNFSLYFGIEECIVVSPSKIRELKAADEDTITFPEMLDAEDTIKSLLRQGIKKRDIKKESFEELFKEELNKNYINIYFDNFMSMWIDMMQDAEEEFLDNDTPGGWQELSANVFAVISTFFALTLNDENLVLDLSEVLYYTIMPMYKEELNIDYDIYVIDLQ